MNRVVALGILILALLGLISSISYVGTAEAAILDSRFGEPRLLSAGIHFHLPLLSPVVHYSLAPRKVSGETKVETRDNLNFRIRYSLEVSFVPETLLVFHSRRGGRPLEPVIRQFSDEIVRKASSTLRADEVLGPGDDVRWPAALTPAGQEHGLKTGDIEVNPVDPKVLVNAALVYQERNLPAAALVLGRLAVLRFPQDAHVHYGLGRVLELQGQEAPAENEYVQALFLDPAAPEPMGRLVGRLLKRKEFARAERLLNAALEKDRTSARHFNWLGITLQLQAKYDEAKQAFQKAVELDPKSAEFRGNQGALLLTMGDLKGAQESLKEAIRIQPNSPLSLYNLGVALAEDKKEAEAIPFFEQAEKSGPPSPGLLNALARAYQEVGNTPKAVAALERSLRLKPNQPEAQALLKRLQSGRGAPSPKKTP